MTRCCKLIRWVMYLYTAHIFRICSEMADYSRILLLCGMNPGWVLMENGIRRAKNYAPAGGPGRQGRRDLLRMLVPGWGTGRGDVWGNTVISRGAAGDMRLFFLKGATVFQALVRPLYSGQEAWRGFLS